jgi:hypothetical protein
MVDGCSVWIVPAALIAGFRFSIKAEAWVWLFDKLLREP